jgi:hypothetical protein
MSKNIRIEVPLEIAGQNKRDRWHWTMRAKDKRDWAFAFANKAPKAHGKRAVCIISVRPRKFSDHANLVGGCKGLVDGLVSAGLLVDDSIECCHIEYKQFTRREFGGQCRTIVDLIDLD